MRHDGAEPAGLVTPRNTLLARIQRREWDALRAEAEYVHFPVTHVLVQQGDPVSAVYFPDTGIISAISSMSSGHQVEVAAFSSDGLVGAAAILNVERMPYTLIVQSPSRGYQVPAEVFRRAFDEYPGLRRVTLTHVGVMLQQISRSAACNRFHSHRERLARWLLVTMHKSGSHSLDLTHEFIAQMVGGPRHAVTAALTELRELDAIRYVRGRIDLVDEARLMSCACECHVQDRATVR